MASGDSGRALDQDSLEKLSAAAFPGKFLSQIHFVIEPTEEGANPVVAVCSAVYVRPSWRIHAGHTKFRFPARGPHGAQPRRRCSGFPRCFSRSPDQSWQVSRSDRYAFGRSPLDCSKCISPTRELPCCKVQRCRPDQTRSQWASWPPVPRSDPGSSRCLGRVRHGRGHGARVPRRSSRSAVLRTLCTVRAQTCTSRLPTACEKSGRVGKPSNSRPAGPCGSSAFCSESPAVVRSSDQPSGCRPVEPHSEVSRQLGPSGRLSGNSQIWFLLQPTSKIMR